MHFDSSIQKFQEELINPKKDNTYVSTSSFFGAGLGYRNNKHTIVKSESFHMQRQEVIYVQ